MLQYGKGKYWLIALIYPISSLPILYMYYQWFLHNGWVIVLHMLYLKHLPNYFPSIWQYMICMYILITQVCIGYVHTHVKIVKQCYTIWHHKITPCDVHMMHKLSSAYTEKPVWLVIWHLLCLIGRIPHWCVFHVISHSQKIQIKIGEHTNVLMCIATISILFI